MWAFMQKQPAALLSHVRHPALLLIACAALQSAFWWQTHRMRPDLSVVPTPPGRNALHALSLGDNESYFRLWAFQLQNFGDSFGRFTSLRYYDYAKLTQWLMLLDTLNARSNMLPSMATYYFSQTQNKPDVRYLIRYLYTHAVRDVAHKWWWLLQSIYLAMYKANDMDLALKVAAPMIDPGVPVWAQQMIAVVHEKRGEMADALRIMETIHDNAAEMSDQDLRYMEYFVRERIGRLDEISQEGSSGRAKR